MKTRETGITIVSLVLTVIILIILAGVSINTLFSENGIITMAKKAKENVELAQIEEQTELNELYTKLETETGDTGGISYDAIAELIEFKKIIAEAITNKGVETKETDSAETMADNITKLQTNTEGTAESSDIISEKTAWVNGIQLTGTMTNNGAKTATLNAGGSYTIPAGYHNGSGKITANSLASQTSASATAADILSGKTAWVNGIKLTGTMINNGAKTATLNAGSSYTIPAGYHNGSGKITANSLASQTSATATAAQITKGYTAWVNGVKITGTRPDSVKYESGQYETGYLENNTTYRYPITFSKPFDTIPTVTLVALGYTSQTLSALNVSRTGFTLQIANGWETKHYGMTINWTATNE